MQINILRTTFTNASTIGKLSVNGSFQCYTLEDKVRPDGEKVFGQTAIPAGEYKVIVNMSAHFGQEMPLLLNVLNFEGVRIHSGNKAADTEGCVLVGATVGDDFIGQSRAAFNELFPQIQAAFNDGEEILLTIEGEPQ